MQKGMVAVIKISRENYDKLTEMGKKNDTYNDIITRILERIDLSKLESIDKKKGKQTGERGKK